ncbi:MAG: radical SAM family heme chaperone HemW [Clostridia bacterium]|nr:radical SAM family heme chaperone HemW [Clostridia bacterium]
MINNLGLYIHIPFCTQKCSYCNFYSFNAESNLIDSYFNTLLGEITAKGKTVTRPVSSVYIGGGTPTVAGGKRLYELLNTINKAFNVLPNAEITVEANPGDNLVDILPFLKKGGCNRLSLGVQSANQTELNLLRRRHNLTDVENAVNIARKTGINNISLDLMLGLPHSNLKTLKTSLDFLTGLNPQHISAYILKLEQGTPLFKNQANLNMPNEDMVADQYLFMCDYLSAKGFNHYEISNFAKDGYQSRHNSSYWQLCEYIGFGPAAHSFFNGKRYYYKPNITDYISNPTAIPDGDGGSEFEYIMLSLRMSDGINSAEFKNRYGKSFSEKFLKTAETLQKNGLVNINGQNISLTNKGMLVSNSVINLFTEVL